MKTLSKQLDELVSSVKGGGFGAPEAEREFSDTEDCLQACLAAWGKASTHIKHQQKDNQQ